jgi:hypothetical protein
VSEPTVAELIAELRRLWTLDGHAFAALERLQSELAALREDAAQCMDGRNREANARITAEDQRDRAVAFVRYIKHRYEEEWDEPITERFYNEAIALLREIDGEGR